MAVFVRVKCGRCGRDDSIEVKDSTEGVALEKALETKTATLKLLEDFIATLPKDSLPDYVGVFEGRVVAHNYLCDPPGGEKRACANRVGQLVSDIDKLPERKPREKKPAASGA